jgi:hypothetical protein
LCSISRWRILGRNWDKIVTSFPPCYSQLPLLTDFTSPLLWAKAVWNWFVMYTWYRKPKSENSIQKPQRNCTFMNSASRWLCSIPPWLMIRMKKNPTWRDKFSVGTN